MTIRVGAVRRDGTREFRPTRVVEVEPDRTALREDACRYPPCACPKCRPDLQRGDAAMRALTECPPLRNMAALWAWWRM